jgi:HEAT repeat protein
MLSAAPAGGTPVRRLNLRNWLPRIAAAIVLLIIGAGIGWQVSRSSQQTEQLAKLQAELNETKSVMLQLVQNDRTSSRIKAVNLTLEFGQPDPEIIASLDHLLKTDESPNVRLAAIDALVQFSRAEAARQALVEALPLQDKPVVQIALIHALIQIDDKSALPYLDQLIERDDVMDKVKDEARLGRFRL